MELRRFNIFLYSGVGRRIRFLSELEFEHGTEEISLETALVDFVITPSLVVRAGILLPPIGAFNANHDSPRYDFVERPLVSTEIIPATLSEVGFGVHGRLAPRGFSVSYDAYLTNGLGDGVILNPLGRTRLASGKSEERFAEDNNGSPAVSGRVAALVRRWGEFGLSYYGGVYNSYRTEGVAVAPKRRVSLVAVDLTTSVGPVDLRGETAWARIDEGLTFGQLNLSALGMDMNGLRNFELSLASVETHLTEMRNQRDALAQSTWDKVKRVRASVKGIFGDDSTQYEMVGGTRLSDRKPVRRTQATIL